MWPWQSTLSSRASVSPAERQRRGLDKGRLSFSQPRKPCVTRDEMYVGTRFIGHVRAEARTGRGGDRKPSPSGSPCSLPEAASEGRDELPAPSGPSATGPTAGGGRRGTAEPWLQSQTAWVKAQPDLPSQFPHLEKGITVLTRCCGGSRSWGVTCLEHGLADDGAQPWDSCEQRGALTAAGTL